MVINGRATEALVMIVALQFRRTWERQDKTNKEKNVYCSELVGAKADSH